MYVLMSTFELSLDSIWFLCFSESALHQYYMPTLAEEGFFLLGNDDHRKHKHTGRKQQKFKLFPRVEAGERLTAGRGFQRDNSLTEQKTTKREVETDKTWRQSNRTPTIPSSRGNVVGTGCNTSCRALHKTPAITSLTPGYRNSRLQWPENN